MGSMGKGQAWVNRESIGRYWPAYKAYGSCGACDYRGRCNEKKCQTNCGEPSQRWYHVPRSWLKPTGNFLVVFEEWGGDPTGIAMVRRTLGSVCARVDELQPTLASWQTEEEDAAPEVHLSCEPGQNIANITFASFGTPQGECGSFSEGSCHAPKSYDALRNNCVGQQSCKVAVATPVFGGDQCPGTTKQLAVEAVCE